MDVVGAVAEPRAAVAEDGVDERAAGLRSVQPPNAFGLLLLLLLLLLKLLLLKLLLIGGGGGGGSAATASVAFLLPNDRRLERRRCADGKIGERRAAKLVLCSATASATSDATSDATAAAAAAFEEPRKPRDSLDVCGSDGGGFAVATVVGQRRRRSEIGPLRVATIAAVAPAAGASVSPISAGSGDSGSGSAGAGGDVPPVLVSVAVEDGSGGGHWRDGARKEEQ